MSQNSPPRILSVLRTDHVIGFLRSAGPKGVTAYDADGQLLGLFQDKSKAISAITSAASS